MGTKSQLKETANNNVVPFQSRVARYSKINLDLVLSCINIQDNSRYNIYIQLSIKYEDCDVKNVKNIVLS